MTWTLPGDNRISGTAEGPDGVVGRVRLISSYGVDFALLHVLVSRDNVALNLHNTATRGDLVLDEHLATVFTLRDGKVARIETFLSDVDGMNRFFAWRQGSDGGVRKTSGRRGGPPDPGAPAGVRGSAQSRVTPRSTAPGTMRSFASARPRVRASVSASRRCARSPTAAARYAPHPPLEQRFTPASGRRAA
ncbi:hypothetical protein [Lentzea sp.]|uniref:hypothetical protein n=1 Tax=Lentzea sp. TaxID=56099 RepID=UPI002BB0C90B|nr:hypothetical protein [Lentzea sp.]HUQ58207.1 hypothetical protein [Lentzea sp.]